MRLILSIVKTTIMKIKLFIFLLFIFMSAFGQQREQEISLDTVTITFHAGKKVKFPRSTRECTWISIKPGTEVVSILYPKRELQEKKILSLSVKISDFLFFTQKKDIKRFFKTHYPLLKIYLYRVDDSGNLKQVFESNTFIVQSPRKDILTIHLSHSSFYFSESGLGVGIALLGFKKENGEIVKDKISIKFAATSRSSGLYRQKTYLRFSQIDNLVPVTNEENSRKACNLSVAFSFR